MTQSHRCFEPFCLFEKVRLFCLFSVFFLTSSPTQAATPLYEVNNGASSGVNSFPAALAYVNANGGNVTFGPGAVGQTCVLEGHIPLINPIILDLTELNAKFSIDGGVGYVIFSSGSSPVGLTFSSSANNRTFSFASNSGFHSFGSGIMSTTVRERATLALSAGSNLLTTGPAMITNVYGSVILSNSFIANEGAGPGTATVYREGLLAMDASIFLGTNVTIAGGSTFISGLNGAYFAGSSLFLSSGATHQATIGMGHSPVQIYPWVFNNETKAAHATLEGAILNIISPQNLISLQGNTYTIMRASPGNSILGQYGVLQFSGSSKDLPYDVRYLPNSSWITDVNVVFPPANMVRNNGSDPLIPYSFPAALAYVNAHGGSVTFGPGAVGQTCRPGSDISITTLNPLTFDLAGLSPNGFSIVGGSAVSGYGIGTYGSTPVSLTFISPVNSGSFSFIGSYLFNQGSGALTTTVERNANLTLANMSSLYNGGTIMSTKAYGTLTVSNGSYVHNHGTHMTTDVFGAMRVSAGGALGNSGSGAMTTTVSAEATLDLSNYAYFANYGTDMITNINGTLTLTGSSFFDNAGSGAMNTTISKSGTLTFSDVSYFKNDGTHMMTDVYGAMSLLAGSGVANYGSGVMHTNICGSLTASGISGFANHGTDMVTTVYGSLMLSDSSNFNNQGPNSPLMTTAVKTGASLSLSGGSLIENYTPGASMTTTVDAGGTLALSIGSSFQNDGSAMMTNINGTLNLSFNSFVQNNGPGPLNTIIGRGATLNVFKSSYFRNYGSNMTTTIEGTAILSEAGSAFRNDGLGPMLTNVQGSLTLLNTSYLYNGGTHMAITVNGTLSLSDQSFVKNVGSGPMMITLQSGATLSLVDGSRFFNLGSGPMITTIQSGATLSLAAGSSYFYNTGAGTSMTTTVQSEATLSLAGAGSGFANSGSDAGSLMSAGLLSMDARAGFWGYTAVMNIVMASGGIFASGTGGAIFYASNLILSSGAIHQAAIGQDSQPVTMTTLNSRNSVAILNGATLNVISPQSLDILRGNTYSLFRATPGNTITGQYGTLQFNGSSTNLPYDIRYFPNTSWMTSIDLIFPTNTPTHVPTLEPSYVPSLFPSETPSLEPSLAPSLFPSPIPTHVPSQTPSLLPSRAPSHLPSIAPSFLPSGPPSSQTTAGFTVEPSLLPTNLPSALATAALTLVPTATRFIANLTNDTTNLSLPGPFSAEDVGPSIGAIAGGVAGAVVTLTAVCVFVPKCVKWIKSRWNGRFDNNAAEPSSGVMHSRALQSETWLDDEPPLSCAPSTSRSESGGLGPIAHPPRSLTQLAQAFPSEGIWTKDLYSFPPHFGEIPVSQESVRTVTRSLFYTPEIELSSERTLPSRSVTPHIPPESQVQEASLPPRPPSGRPLTIDFESEA